MNRKMTQMLQPSFQLYFVCLILFAAASAFFSLYLAAAEAVVVVLLGLYYRENSRRRRREIAKYIENVTGNMDVATKDTMVNSPLPMVIFRPESDDIIWTNDRFLHLAGEKEHLFDAKLSSVIPDFDTRWLMEGKNECPTEVTFGPRRFLVYGHLVRASGREGGFLATTYWVDVTEFCQVRDQFRRSRPVMAVLLLDNYEDLMKNQTENQRSTIYAEVNARLDAWVAGHRGHAPQYGAGPLPASCSRSSTCPEFVDAEVRHPGHHPPGGQSQRPGADPVHRHRQGRRQLPGADAVSPTCPSRWPSPGGATRRSSATSSPLSFTAAAPRRRRSAPR